MAIEEMNLHLNTNDETLKPDNLDFQHTTLLNALKESEDHFRQLILGLPVALYTTDAEGYINLYNHAAVELWGRVPEIGKDRFCGSWQIFRPDGDPLPWEECPIALTLKGIPLKGNEEVVLMRPDGSKRHIIPYPRAIYNQHHRITGAINTLIDVTGIKKSEQELLRKERSLRLLTASLEQQIDDRTADLQKKHAELKKSEERYYRMIDEIEDYAIIFLDPHGIVQNWNRGAQKIKGYTESEIIGSHFRIFYREEDRVNKIPEKLIAEAAANGKSLHEGWRVRKDGFRR
jgi:PAS domain S-box-containing protein